MLSWNICDLWNPLTYPVHVSNFLPCNIGVENSVIWCNVLPHNLQVHCHLHYYYKKCHPQSIEEPSFSFFQSINKCLTKKNSHSYRLCIQPVCAHFSHSCVYNRVSGHSTISPCCCNLLRYLSTGNLRKIFSQCSIC